LKTVTSGCTTGQRRRRERTNGDFTLNAFPIPVMAFGELKLLVQPIPPAAKRMSSGATHVASDKEGVTSLRARIFS